MKTCLRIKQQQQQQQQKQTCLILLLKGRNKHTKGSQKGPHLTVCFQETSTEQAEWLV